MTKQKNTKRALLASVLSMMLCMAMLVGSTFAWFTDSVTSGKNKIVAGNLDVELSHTNGKVTDQLVEGATDLFVNADGTAIKWEPGVMAYENFTVKNVGSLALKYKLTMNVDAFNTVDGKSLKDVLKVAIVDGAFNGDRAAAQALDFDKTIADFEKNGTIEANGADKTYAVVIYWEPSAGDNDYNLNNGRKADDDSDELFIDLGVSLVATQDTVESDSFDHQYDKDANYPVLVASQEELNDAVSNANADVPTTIELSAGTYKLPATSVIRNKDITFTGSQDTIIDMKDVATGQNTADAKIAFNGVKVEFANSNYKGIQHAEKVVYKDCTITGKQFMYAKDVEFINCKFENRNDYCVWTYGAKNVTFTDCEFTTGGKAILVYNEEQTSSFVANITLNNCTFNSDRTLAVDKAAVETGSNGGNTETSNKYNLTFNTCIVNGFAENKSTSPLWGNKNDLDVEHLNVVIDGVDKY